RRTAPMMRPPITNTDARIPASTRGSFMPAKPAAAPTAIIARKAPGTATAIVGLRPAKRAAHRPTPAIARRWSRPLNGCRKPEASWPGCASAGPAASSSRAVRKIFERITELPFFAWLSLRLSRTGPYRQSTLPYDEGGDIVDSLVLLEIGEQERPDPTHLAS